MNVQPLGNRVLVRRLKDATVTPGGVQLPDGIAHKQTFLGEVIAVGPGNRDFNGVMWACTVNPGDKVIFLKQAGTNIGMDAERLTILTEDDVLGTVLDG